MAYPFDFKVFKLREGLKLVAWIRNPHIFAGSALRDMVILNTFYYEDS
jgi:hypothetical protein